MIQDTFEIFFYKFCCWLFCLFNVSYWEICQILEQHVSKYLKISFTHLHKIDCWLKNEEWKITDRQLRKTWYWIVPDWVKNSIIVVFAKRFIDKLQTNKLQRNHSLWMVFQLDNNMYNVHMPVSLMNSVKHSFQWLMAHGNSENRIFIIISPFSFVYIFFFHHPKILRINNNNSDEFSFRSDNEI